MPRLSTEDWLAIETAYRAGTATNAELAAKYGCHVSSIKKKAKLGNWIREPAEVKRQLVAAKLAAPSSRESIRDGVARTLDAEADRDARVLARAADTFEKIMRKCDEAADALPPEQVVALKIAGEALHKAHDGYRKARNLDERKPEASDFESVVRKLNLEGGSRG
jgi:hypothetical protein